MKNNIMRITMIVLLLATTISMSACGSKTSNDSVKTKTHNNNGFVVVSNQVIADRFANPKWLTIMYDSDTLVMYAVTYGGNSNTSQFTPLYNADGTLKTYAPNTESN